MTPRRRSPRERFKTLLRGFGALVTVAVLAVGALVLYAGIQNYASGDVQSSGFDTTVLGIAILSFPLALLFSAQANKSYRRSKSRYEIPDTPLRFFLLSSFGAGFLLLSVVSILMYLMYLRS
jgi:hypothetical protein